MTKVICENCNKQIELLCNWGYYIGGNIEIDDHREVVAFDCPHCREKIPIAFADDMVEVCEAGD